MIKKVGNLIKKNKSHFLIALALLLLTFVQLYEFTSLTDLPGFEHITSYFPMAETLKQSVFEYGDIWPLWSPYIMGGNPHMGYPPTLGVDYIMGWLTLILPFPAGAVNLNIVVDVFLAGLFMYIFMFYLTKSRRASFVAGMLYAFNGYVMKAVIQSTITQLNSYTLVPLVFFFAIKTFKEPDWIKNSIFTGLVFAVMARSNPDMKILMFTIPVYVIFLAFQVISKKPVKMAKRVLIVGLIAALVLAGLSAQRILPAKEFLDMSSRSHNTWEQSSSRRTAIWEVPFAVIEPIYKGNTWFRYCYNEIKPLTRYGGHYKIGIIGFLLACFAVYRKPKNKLVLFLLTATLFSIAILTGSFVFWFLWKFIPPFDSFRYVERAYFILVFVLVTLAGLGTNELLKKLKNKKKVNIIYAVIVILIIGNLFVFNLNPVDSTQPLRDVYGAISHMEALKYISKQDGTFRMQTYETRGIDYGTEWADIPLKLQILYGNQGAWIVEYMNIYLSLANRNPAKFWGILNTKYITSQTEISDANFTLIDKFGECTDCYPEVEPMQKVWGPYVYRNDLFLPRAFQVENAVLVVGEKENALNLIYAVMLNAAFDPKNTVLINGEKKISEYNIEELKIYDAILLSSESTDRNSNIVLREYANMGGRILPNVIENQYTITEEDILNLMQEFKGDIKASADYITHDFDHYEARYEKPQEGWLVLSEKFALFNGWNAKADGKKLDIERANGIVSAVYLDQPAKSIYFSYLPRSVIIGSLITAATLLGIIGFFLFRKVVPK